VLLSFAQFEREVIGERIRDKFAASRRKGMWMGGWAPLGYDIKDRKLVVNDLEAKRVQSIFKRFARGIQPQILVEELAKEGAKNKNGKSIDKGYLYRVLHNRVYLGEAVHKGTAYPGEHAPIIERNVWDQVQSLISPSPRERTKRTFGRTPALLKGLVFGPNGTAMTPAHTRKRGKLYRYYVSTDVLRSGARASPITRIAAAQLETVVVEQIKALLQSPEIVVATWRVARKTLTSLTETEVARELRRFNDLWAELFPSEQARIVQLLVQRVDVSEAGVDITLKVEGLSTIFQDLRSTTTRHDAA
jgi:hypothetical protein